MPSEREYVLGTHDDELLRLGQQHEVWRAIAHSCWSAAGIGPGSRVVDVGAGPGFATFDLAELVGAQGSVVALECSQRFLAATRDRCQGLTQVAVHDFDLMNETPLPVSDVDATWCRWVGSFVSSPQTLVDKIHAALRIGGVAVFHEYVDYSSFRILPPRPAIREFVDHVMSSWRAAGGEPDIARQLPALLCGQERFRILRAVPHVLTSRPGEAVWNWPAEFIRINVRRLQSLERVDAAWSARVVSALAAAERNSNSVMITPMLLEIVAEKLA